MSFSIIQSPTFRQDTDPSATVQGTFGATTVSGRLLVALACAIDTGYDSLSSIGFADAGTNTFASASFGTGPGGYLFEGAAIGYVENAVGKASHEVICTPVAVATGFGGVANLTLLEISGMALSGALEAAATPTNGTDNAPTGTPITPAANGIHIAIVQTRVFQGTPHTLTPADGWTPIVNDTTNYTGYGVIYRAAVNGVQQTPAWAMDAANDGGWTVLHVVFKEASAAAQPLNRMLMGVG